MRQKRSEEAIVYIGKGNGKVISLQAWTGPYSSRRSRSPGLLDIKT